MDSPNANLLGRYVTIDGELYVCIALVDKPSVIFEKVDGKGVACEHCGCRSQKSYVVDSPHYLSSVKPVRTIDVDGKPR